MDCSDLCPYNQTNFTCEVPQLSSEQIKNLILTHKISENLYSGSIFNHPILVSTLSVDGICTQLLLKLYSPKILGAWKCEITKQSVTIVQNLGYRLTDESVNDYIQIISTIFELNNVGVSHNNLSKDNILLNIGSVVFLDFSKSTEYKKLEYLENLMKLSKSDLTDLIRVNELFKGLGDLPDWTILFPRFHQRNGEYPKSSDIRQILNLKFGFDRVPLENTIPGTKISFVDVRYLTSGLAQHLQVLHETNCDIKIQLETLTKDCIDTVILAYQEENIIGFFVIHKESRGYYWWQVHKIYDVCVLQDFRGKKLSQRMIEKYIDTQVNVADFVELSVDINNDMFDAAIKSYANVGFKNPGYLNGSKDSITLSYRNEGPRQPPNEFQIQETVEWANRLKNSPPAGFLVY